MLTQLMGISSSQSITASYMRHRSGDTERVLSSIYRENEKEVRNK